MKNAVAAFAAGLSKRESLGGRVIAREIHVAVAVAIRRPIGEREPLRRARNDSLASRVAACDQGADAPMLGAEHRDRLLEERIAGAAILPAHDRPPLRGVGE